MKRILAVAVALILLVAALPLTALAGGEIVLTVDEWTEVQAGNGQSVYCTFTAPETGIYQFMSDAKGHDPFMALLDENGEAIDGNDDWNDLDFRFVLTLEKGETCFFEVSAYGDELFRFPVKIGPVPKLTGVELFEGADSITMAVGEWRAAKIKLFPEEAIAESVELSSADESIVFPVGNAWQALVAGETTLTVTVDGTITDTIAVRVEEPGQMEGCGTQQIVLTSQRQASTFAFRVETDGWYEIFAEGAYDSVLNIYEKDGSEFWLLDDSDDVYGRNYGYTGYFEAGKTYYLVNRTFDNNHQMRGFFMNVRPAEKPEEPPQTGVGFHEDSITVTKGTAFHLDYWLGQEDYESDIAVADDSVVEIIYYRECKALQVGETTVTITTESGKTATLAVTVVDNPALPLGEKTEISGMSEELYVFTPEQDGVYVFRSFGEGDPYMVLYDEEMNELDNADDNAGEGDFYLLAELVGGQTYYVRAGNYMDGTGRFLVAPATPATSVTLVLDEDIYLKREGDTYYVFTGQVLGGYVQFGEEESAMEEYCDVFPGAGIIEGEQDGLYGWMAAEPGIATMYVESENGLTHSITIVAVEYVPGDITLDGQVTAADKAVLQTFLKDTSAAGDLWYLLDYNEDGLVDAKDLEAMDEVAVGELGDVDNDGSITSTDARLTLQYYVGKITERDLNIDLADVDSDGSITSTDARLILQYYAGKITAWP